MKNKVLAVFSLAIGLFPVSPLLFAHHSDTQIDKDNATTVTGTVTKWLLANPHPAIDFDGDVKDSQGNVVKWIAAEGGGVLGLRKAGWTNKTLMPGDRILVQGHQVKDGRPVMGFRKIYRCSGEELPVGYEPGSAKANIWKPISPERVREMCANGIVEGAIKPELFSR